MAPDDARKEFEKGEKDFSRKKYPDAEKHFAKAVEAYPQYAQAWEMLARAQRIERNYTEAEKSYLAAISADEKFISPYIQLSGMYAGQAKWDAVLRLTAKVVALDANNYPDAYFLQAFAFYNLKQVPEAETSARKAVETDRLRRFPRAELLLGRILQTKGDDAGAAEHLRTYIKMEPNSPEAPNIQSFLAQFDKDAAAETKPK
ncbi:MAG: tetratricopeptide repeat protein [Acidobacteriaceae bacterium]